jgi:transcriptional regulator with XRE-family HTH domain
MFNQKTERAQIGMRLRTARERAHISIEDAAEAIGVQPLAVAKWERGTALPGLIEFRALLQTYGCMACDILFEENPWTLTPDQAAELVRVTRGASPSLRAKVDVALAMHSKGVEPVWKV